MYPAQYLNHKLELLWSWVVFSIESADSAVISIDSVTNLHSVKT